MDKLQLIEEAISAVEVAHPVLDEALKGIKAFRAANTDGEKAQELADKLLPLIEEYLPKVGILGNLLAVVKLFEPYIGVSIEVIETKIANAQPTRADSGIAETLPTDAPKI